MLHPAIVTLTRHPEIFDRLRVSVDRYEPDALKIVVTSGGAEIHAPGWSVVEGVEPFVFPRNANLGMQHVPADWDLVVINDDCEMTMPILATCRQLVERHTTIGVLSPQIDGGVGNDLQMVGRAPVGWDARGYFTSDAEHLSGVCIYYPARTRATVGVLDERFDEYGCDDQDYCHRVKLAGLELGITPLCSVKHGFDGRAASSTFGRFMDRTAQRASIERMRAKFKEKFGL